MSHVTECIELYVGDESVTDAQFRAIMLDAHARDKALRPVTDPLDDMQVQLAEHSDALVLLNRVDTLRAGQLRVLRERVDRLWFEQFRQEPARLDNMEGKA